MRDFTDRWLDWIDSLLGYVRRVFMATIIGFTVCASVILLPVFSLLSAVLTLALTILFLIASPIMLLFDFDKKTEDGNPC